MRKKLWDDVMKIIKPNIEIQSFKGKAHAVVEEITDNLILLKLEKIPTTKNIAVKLFKSDFVKALSLLNENGGIRQKDFDSKKARYLLSILNSLPYFRSEYRETQNLGKIKKTKFLVWDNNSKQFGV